MKGFIKRRIYNQQDAEDILQEVFLKLHQNIHSLQDAEKIHAWIYTITRNTIIDFYRAKSQNTVTEALTEDIILEVEEEVGENSEIATCLRVMIDCLPIKYKQAILYTEFENLSQKELAKLLGLSVSGAKSRVQRARRILREMLLNCCSLEFDHRGNIIAYKHKEKDCKYC